jgi:DNA-directed RNA polymerase subunit RPC12/RpoP
MIIIRCSRCGRKVLKYQKLGTGRLWHCWKARIVEDYSIRAGTEVKCPCGNVIGIEQAKWIKLKQDAFSYSGATIKR